ncbi:unnamed protein product [Zymoseptoria tritici ST99CH_1A5]|uniref:LysM domain-containing protein n=1 Tax=Zymoseptoria tritici ST99CH_1A5 TaxID=1276529 RepID=A0A1Y6LWH7_ZYMTR|nr:unnamed protein product [Zymoseptoria tritici ST99CH_1A5]
MKVTTIIAALLSVAVVDAQNNAQCRKLGLPCHATKTIPYVVKKGDTLTRIAHVVYKRKVGICDLAYTNHIGYNPDLIYEDQTLLIPTDCKTIDDGSCLKKHVS